MSLDELYKIKGELVTTIEIAQARLKETNSKIVEAINKEHSKVNKPTE